MDNSQLANANVDIVRLKSALYDLLKELDKDEIERDMRQVLNKAIDTLEKIDGWNQFQEEMGYKTI